MNNSIASQLYLLLIFIISGIAIGIFFDIFRILRRTFKTSDFVTYIEDIIFWLLTGIFFLIILFKFNNGEIRNYVVLGVIIGIITYMLTVSRYFIKISVKIINIIKKILTIPIRIISKIFKPLSFIVINIRKSIFNFIKRIKKLSKKCYIKKDFRF